MKKVNLKTLVIAGLATGGLLMSCGPQGTDKTTSCTPMKKQETTQKRVADGAKTGGTGSSCPSGGTGSSCSAEGSSCSGSGCNGCAPTKDNATSNTQKHMKNQRATAL